MRRAFAPKQVETVSPGRALRQRPAGRKNVRRGEQIGNSVLTEAIARRIRELHVPGKVGGGKIAKLLAAEGIVVKPRTVDGVLHQGHWRHVRAEQP